MAYEEPSLKRKMIVYDFDLVLDLIYCTLRHFQQYFSYIMATSFSGGRSRVPGENHRPWASNW